MKLIFENSLLNYETSTLGILILGRVYVLSFLGFWTKRIEGPCLFDLTREGNIRRKRWRLTFALVLVFTKLLFPFIRKCNCISLGKCFLYRPSLFNNFLFVFFKPPWQQLVDNRPKEVSVRIKAFDNVIIKVVQDLRMILNLLEPMFCSIFTPMTLNSRCKWTFLFFKHFLLVF